MTEGPTLPLHMAMSLCRRAASISCNQETASSHSINARRGRLGVLRLSPARIQLQTTNLMMITNSGTSLHTGDGTFDQEGANVVTTTEKVSPSRQLWTRFVWALTFWIPSSMLRYLGRMKRADVRMAWREKVVIVFAIFFLNAFVVFYIIEFGRLLCPNYDKAWNAKELSYHDGDDDFWVSVRGRCTMSPNSGDNSTVALRLYKSTLRRWSLWPV
ncbi:hypothetical protein MRB53_040968 [Persea americana]|nr:hypothetical protein MRB53_040968 [Persea americana]